MSDPFSAAIIKLTGYGKASMPAHLDIPLDPLIWHKTNQIFDFADNLHPDWSKLDLAGAGAWAKEQLRLQFPFLTSEALDALAWQLTFGWK